MESTFVESMFQLGALGGIAALCLRYILDDKKSDKVLFRDTIEDITEEMKEDRKMYRETLGNILTSVDKLGDSTLQNNIELKHIIDDLVRTCNHNTVILNKLGDKYDLDI